MDILWLILGLVLILAGANFLTDGAASVARRLGISDLVVGLTVVAFGTSTPELVISIMAAISGNAPLAVGNVVGSNIFNILAIIGLTSLVRPIVIERSVMTRQMPLMLLSSLLLLMLGNSGWIDGTGVNEISRVSGIFLDLLFILFMIYTVVVARHESELHPETRQEENKKKEERNVLLSTVYILGGLAALVWGGDRFVDGASGIARSLGMSDAMIGLTIVAAGTSLPELAASVAAAIKGHPGLAVGNVIGSNIFNTTLVLGGGSTILPLPFNGVTNVDLFTLVGASLLFIIFGWWIKERTITRLEGGIMFACYILYTLYLISTI